MIPESVANLRSSAEGVGAGGEEYVFHFHVAIALCGVLLWWHTGSFATALSATALDFLRPYFRRLVRLWSDWHHGMTVIASFDSSLLGWLETLVWSTLRYLGFLSILQAGVMLYARAAEFTPGQSWVAFTFVTAASAPAVAYFVGRWVGERCRRFGVWISLAFVPIADVGNLVALWFGRPLPKALVEQVLEGMMSHFSASSMRGLRYLILGTQGMAWLAGLLGYWRGERGRVVAYLNYIGDRLTSDSWKALRDIAYEDANRCGGSSGGSESEQIRG